MCCFRVSPVFLWAPRAPCPHDLTNFSGPACTGAHTIINTSALYTDLTTLDFYGGKVASLFCEPATSSEPNRARRTLVREGLRENDKVGGDERFSLEELQRAGG